MRERVKGKAARERKHIEMAKLDGNYFFRHVGARERYFIFIFLSYSFVIRISVVNLPLGSCVVFRALHAGSATGVGLGSNS